MESKRPSQEPIMNTVSIKEKAIFIGSVTLLVAALAVIWRNDQSVESSIIDTITSHRVNASVIDLSHTYNPRNIQMGANIEGCPINTESLTKQSRVIILSEKGCISIEDSKFSQAQ